MNRAEPASRTAANDRAQSVAVRLNLSRMLGLRPLDRVQLNNKYAIDDMQFGPQLGRVADDLPFLFFQRVTSAGELELRTPTGYAWKAAPGEVCDVIPGEPLVVRAMTEEGFCAYLARRPAERGAPCDPSWYAPAYVLHVDKDRWNRVDRICVWFLDERLNREPARYLPVHPEDRPAVEKRARRTEMPVLGKGGVSQSANKGCETATRLARATVTTFMVLALRRQAAAAGRLTTAGLSNPSHAQLNRLRAAGHGPVNGDQLRLLE